LKTTPKRIKGTLQIYAVGILTLCYALSFPFYKVLHYLVCALCVVFVWALLYITLPQKAVYTSLDFQKTGSSDADKIIKRSTECLLEISKAAVLVEDAQTALCIQNIISDAKKTLTFLQKHPQRANELCLFDIYLLPAVLKLTLNCHRLQENCNVPLLQKNKTALKKAEETFENLLASLYYRETLDISTDLAAIEGLMGAQDLI